ncbi:MAG: carboxypeptidase regulatory-like domain-containing protein, partial [Candidatus Thermoplasmatota archaeon]
MRALFIFLIILLPLISAVPTQPLDKWGIARLDGNAVGDGAEISAWIDGVCYGKNKTFHGDGSFNILVNGKDTDAITYKDGGIPGDYVFYSMNYKNKFYIANEVDIFEYGGTGTINMNFISEGQPAQLKINELVIEPKEGNDYIYIFNPNDRKEELGKWRLENNNTWSMELSGTIEPYSSFYIDLGGDILNNTADELKLSWKSEGKICKGMWFVMDRVEYGNQILQGENTTLFDFPYAPGKGRSLIRKLNGTDSDNCQLDFKVNYYPTKRPNGYVEGFVYDENGWEIKYVKIYIPYLIETHTNKAGFFSISLPQGFYKIFAEKEGYEKNETNVSVYAGKKTQIEIILKEIETNNQTNETFEEKNGTILGTVKDKEGMPIQGAIVKIKNYTLETNFDGKFSLLAESNYYNITIYKCGYEKIFEKIFLKKNTTSYFNFTLSKIGAEDRGYIFGVVTDDNGTIPNALIFFDSNYLITNMFGEYWLILQSGTYKLKAQKNGYLNETKEIVVLAGKEQIMN